MPADIENDPFATLTSAISAVVGWFESASVRGVIIGGVANAFLGRTRATRDVDGLVVLGNDSLMAPFLKKAASHGLEPRLPDVVSFARANRVLLLRHFPSQIDVDISCGLLPFEIEVIDRQIVDHMLGFDVPLPTPEDLILMKFIAHRPHDWRDIEGIIDAHPDLDVERVLSWSLRFADIMESPEIAEQLRSLLTAAGLQTITRPGQPKPTKKRMPKLASGQSPVGKKAARKKLMAKGKKVAGTKKTLKSSRKKSHPD